MGNTSTHKQQQSPNFTRLAELFQQLADGTHERSSIKQDLFEKYFSLQDSATLGQLLYKYLTKIGNGCENGLDQKNFVEQMEHILDAGSSSSGQLEMYFRIFSSSHETITYEELSVMCKVCYQMWLYLEDLDGSTEADPTSISMEVVHSLVADKDSAVCIKNCIVWMTDHMPSIFSPLHSWFVTLTLHGNNKLQSCRPVHSIISWPDCPPSILLNKRLFWLLSMVLPEYFITFKYDNLWCNQTAAEKCTEDKEWNILYNSSHDGQSFNRFKHHCFSYNGPTVLLIMVESGTLVAAAIDSNWKESGSYWGSSHCMLLQLEEKLQILKEGEKMVFVNERTRGLPTGILLGDNNKPMITINIDLTSAVLHYKHDSTAYNISSLEVWGCAGLVAKERQKAQQRWERKQAEKLQKVKLPGKWDENPDRAILDMAGVTKDYGHRQ